MIICLCLLLYILSSIHAYSNIDAMTCVSTDKGFTDDWWSASNSHPIKDLVLSTFSKGINIYIGILGVTFLLLCFFALC